jgi:hypothetical protein
MIVRLRLPASARVPSPFLGPPNLLSSGYWKTLPWVKAGGVMTLALFLHQVPVIRVGELHIHLHMLSYELVLNILSTAQRYTFLDWSYRDDTIRVITARALGSGSPL